MSCINIQENLDAPRKYRWSAQRLSRGQINGKHVWQTLKQFPTKKEAEAFAVGYDYGYEDAGGTVI